jgi:crotonobetainyl-CoA:carnitine CoA-transferase CaiB-like acyl-CoA transferase
LFRYSENGERGVTASGASTPARPSGSVGPLSGIRVIDLTTVIMGPSATQILGDLGADVIKIESAGGDSLRWIGPNRTDGMGPLYLNANRNKRSVVLDLKDAEDRGALLSLVADADVFVSNVRPQAMARLGLGYGEVRAVNPEIVYCLAVGYGSDGPKSRPCIIARARAKARRSKCRCWRPWRNSCSPITWAEALSFRRSTRWATSA